MMHAASFYNLLVMTLAAVFGAVGLVHIAGPRFLRDAYDRWDYSQRLRLMVGLWQVIAASWLAEPSLRGWGIAVAAAIGFGAAITHLHHRQYLHAVPATLLLAALIPACLTVPGETNKIRFAPAARSIPQPFAAEPLNIPAGANRNDAGV